LCPSSESQRELIKGHSHLWQSSSTTSMKCIENGFNSAR
jgi:hypothetical protein